MAWHPEMTTVNAGGHRFSLLDRGVGAEAIILIHGIATYSFIWRKILPLLPSDKRLHLVGHDVGGGIAQIFAVRNPEMVINLCLINSVAYDYWPVQPISAMRTMLLRQFAMATLDIGAFGLIVRRGRYHKSRLDPEFLELFSAPARSSLGRKAFLHFARCLDNRNLADISDDLRQFKMPVLLMRGEVDVYLSEEISLRLKREIPACRLLRIPTGGHFIQEDEPQQIAAALSAFWLGGAVAGAVG